MAETRGGFGRARTAAGLTEAAVSCAAAGVIGFWPIWPRGESDLAVGPVETAPLASEHEILTHQGGRTLDFPPWSGGVRSERHAAARMVIPSMLARASAGVR